VVDRLTAHLTRLDRVGGTYDDSGMIFRLLSPATIVYLAQVRAMLEQRLQSKKDTHRNPTGPSQDSQQFVDLVSVSYLQLGNVVGCQLYRIVSGGENFESVGEGSRRPD
jgi:hypothetical protein